MADEDLRVNLDLDTSGFEDGINRAKRGMEGFSSSFESSFRGMVGVAHDGERALLRLDMAQLTVSDSAKRVQDAQTKYNEAVAQFGPGSRQAVAAHQALTSATDADEKTQLRAKLSYASATFELVKMAEKIPAVVTGLTGMAFAAREAAVSMNAAQWATVGVGAGLVGLGAVAGLAALDSITQGAKRGATAMDELTIARKAYDDLPKSNAEIVPEWLTQTIEKVPLLGGMVETSAERQAKAWKRVQDAEKAVADENTQTAAVTRANNELLVKQAEQEAKRLQQVWHQANTTLQSSLGAGLSAVSANLKDLTVQAQRPILIQAGLDPTFVDTLMATQQAEDALTTGALRSSKALRDQTAITAKKDETTEHFRQRLKDLGFTETEIAARIDATGRSLKAQTAATVAAASATAQFSKKASSGGWVTSPDGPQAPSLEAFIAGHTSDIKSAFFGSGQITFSLDAPQVASHLMSGDSGIGIPNVGAWVGSGPGSSQYEKMIGTLKGLITRDLPSNQWDSLLGQLGINGFAHGIEGIVTRPGLFMAGEHGPESIQVRPLALGDKHGGAGDVTVIFQPGSIVVNDTSEAGQKVRDDLARRLRRLGLNINS